MRKHPFVALDHVDGFVKFLKFFVEKYFFHLFIKIQKKKKKKKAKTLFLPISKKYSLTQNSQELNRFLVKFHCLKC